MLRRLSGNAFAERSAPSGFVHTAEWVEQRIAATTDTGCSVRNCRLQVQEREHVHPEYHCQSGCFEHTQLDSFVLVAEAQG